MWAKFLARNCSKCFVLWPPFWKLPQKILYSCFGNAPDTIQRHAKFKCSWSNRNWHKTIVKHNKMRKPQLGGNPSISKHFMSMSISILLLFWCTESYKTAGHYGAPSLSLIVCMKEPTLSTRHVKEPVCMRASHSRSHNLWAKAGSYLWHCLDIAASIFRIHQHMRSTVHGRGTFRLPVMATAWQFVTHFRIITD